MHKERLLTVARALRESKTPLLFDMSMIAYGRDFNNHAVRGGGVMWFKAVQLKAALLLVSATIVWALGSLALAVAFDLGRWFAVLGGVVTGALLHEAYFYIWRNR